MRLPDLIRVKINSSVLESQVLLSGTISKEPSCSVEPSRCGWLQPNTSSEVFKADGRMGRRPFDRRSFRDACAAARLRMRLPENVSVDANLEDLIVGRLAYSNAAY